jgi:hypothetical protein
MNLNIQIAEMVNKNLSFINKNLNYNMRSSSFQSNQTYNILVLDIESQYESATVSPNNQLKALTTWHN